MNVQSLKCKRHREREREGGKKYGEGAVTDTTHFIT